MKIWIFGLIFLVLSLTFSSLFVFPEASGNFAGALVSVFRAAFFPSAPEPAEIISLDSERPPVDFSLSDSKSAGVVSGASARKHPEIEISEILISPIGERFLKLFNPNNFSVDLTGWYLQRKTQSGSLSSLISSTHFEGKTIVANAYFTIARSSTFLADKADILANLTLTSDNAIILKNPSREIVDVLGYGNASDFNISPAMEPGEGEILKRVSGIGDNSKDFKIIQLAREGFQDFEVAEDGELEEQAPLISEPGQEEESEKKEEEVPEIELLFPSTIPADGELVVLFSALGLEDSVWHDVKISIESDITLSRIYDNGVWRSSVFYLTNAIFGSEISKKEFRLVIDERNHNFRGQADVFVRIRKSGASAGNLVFSGNIYIQEPMGVASVAGENEEYEEKQEEGPRENENDEGKEKDEEEKILEYEGCINGQININSAPKDELMKITQIGEARALQIIELRAQEPFWIVEDLDRVDGITKGGSRLDSIINQELACTADSSIISERMEEQQEEEKEEEQEMPVNVSIIEMPETILREEGFFVKVRVERIFEEERLRLGVSAEGDETYPPSQFSFDGESWLSSGRYFEIIPEKGIWEEKIYLKLNSGATRYGNIENGVILTSRIEGVGKWNYHGVITIVEE